MIILYEKDQFRGKNFKKVMIDDSNAKYNYQNHSKNESVEKPTEINVSIDEN